MRYTKEQIEYVRKIAPGRYNDEITEMFNKKFGLNKSVSAINSLKKNYGITSGKLPKRSRISKRLFTPDQEKFIRENAKVRYNHELAEMVNEKFGLNITPRQISNWKKNHRIKSGLTGRFERGHKPWNKGMKGLNTGGEAGWFKKGQVPLNYRPVGSERIDKDGYVMIKVADPNEWRHKHAVMWEKYHGRQIPKAHVVVFLDNDKTNFEKDNLELLSRAELAMMNKYKLFSSNSQLTKTGITLVKLILKTNEIEIKGGDMERYREHLLIAEKNGISEHTFFARLRRGWTLGQAATLPLHTVLKRGDSK